MKLITKPTTLFALLAIGGLAVAAAWLWPATPLEARTGDGAGGEPLAVVEGVAITEADLRQTAGDDLDRLELQKLQFEANYAQQRHQILEGALQQLIQQRLIELEADKRGISAQELVAQEVEAHLSEPTDQEVDAWWQENRARIRATKEQVEPQIRELLRHQKREEALQGLAVRLEEDYAVVSRMEPLRFDVEAPGSPARGPAGAPVTLVEFSDFQCGFCARLQPTLERVRESYGDRVRLVFRNFPLENHQHAFKAAEAALCAEEQGKFWEMKSRMFREQNNLGVEALKQKAAALELDTEEFNSCLDSARYAEQVRQDLRAGIRAGVTGTPAMFVNGRLLSGAVPYDQVAEVIEDELARLQVN